MGKERKDHTAEAEALFRRFAARHGLTYVVDDAEIDLFWNFPVQQGLYHPIVLGLQNCDEINFGVRGFWSYFFPFSKKEAKFEHAIDAWMEGKARIVQQFGWPLSFLVLQVQDSTKWQSCYWCGTWFAKRDKRILMNSPESVLTPSPPSPRAKS